MLRVLRCPTYAKLFGAQIISLIGLGLLTVALGLLAVDVAHDSAGVVMGTAMTIKIVAYVAVSPVASACVARLPRKVVLVGADLLRAGIAIMLPFVTQVWHIYVLIFALQAASATFTPTFQALIPSVLPDEGEYTRALTLSRIAYDLESLVSPALAAALLTVMGFHHLFVGTVIGFLVSASLVGGLRLPRLEAEAAENFLDRLTRGIRVFWVSRELLALMGLNLLVAAPTAMVIVNTVVLVEVRMGRSGSDAAALLAAYGGGSMLVALGMPGVLERFSDRRVMLGGGACLPVVLTAAAVTIGVASGMAQWIFLLIAWGLLGAAISTIETPSARLLQRNTSERDRSAVFAAQFSLSHACYLVTYPVAGVLGAVIGLPAVGLMLVGLAVIGLLVAVAAWRPANVSVESGGETGGAQSVPRGGDRR